MALGTTIKTIQDVTRKDTGVDGDAQRDRVAGRFGRLPADRIGSDR